jgi:hypothetical protein
MALTLTPEQISWIRAASAAPPKLDENALRWIKAASPKPASTALQPLQEMQFQQGLSNANFDYLDALAQNKFDRDTASGGFGRLRRDLLDRLGQQRQALPYQYNRRGIYGSGIWKRGLQDFQKARTNMLGNHDYQRAQSLGRFDLMRQQLESRRAKLLGNIRTARQGAVQQQLLGLNGYGG